MIRVCTACGRKNRIPAKHLADRGSCGACKADLSPAAEPFEVDASDFDEVVTGARVPVLVDFWANWCGPCRMVAPQVKKVAEQLSGKAIVLKVDTDRNPELAQRYEVRGIPNFVVFSAGQAVGREVGAVDQRRLLRLVEAAL